MSENTPPPEWAMREFCKRANLDYDSVLVKANVEGVVLRSAVRAGAALIAAHEEPPVDPLDEIGAEIHGAWASGRQDSMAKALRTALARRGLELVERKP